jgi:hypothetical protein
LSVTGRDVVMIAGGEGRPERCAPEQRRPELFDRRRIGCTQQLRFPERGCAPWCANTLELGCRLGPDAASDHAWGLS